MKRILFALLLGLCANSAWAALPASVQCTSFQNSASLTTSSILSWPAPTTAGAFVWGAVENGNTIGGGELASVTDDSGMNTYQVDKSYGPILATVYGDIFSGHVTAAATVIELHFTDTGLHNFPQWKACEFSGIKTTGWLDQTGTGTAAANPLTVTASGANSQANMLVVALNYAAQCTPSGYTELWRDTTILGGEAAYKIVSASETSAVTWACDPTANGRGIIVTYKAADAGGTAPPSLMLMGVGK